MFQSNLAQTQQVVAPNACEMPIAWLADLATVLGVPFAVLAIFLTFWQLRKSVAIASGQFMLDIEKMIAKFDAVHHKLRPEDEWNNTTAGPVETKEWSQIEDYMGLFEHCELLLQNGSLNTEAFGELYKYRLENIVSNSEIVQAKLVDEKEYWGLFLKILSRYEIKPNV